MLVASVMKKSPVWAFSRTFFKSVILWEPLSSRRTFSRWNSHLCWQNCLTQNKRRLQRPVNQPWDAKLCKLYANWRWSIQERKSNKVLPPWLPCSHCRWRLISWSSQRKFKESQNRTSKSWQRWRLDHSCWKIIKGKLSRPELISDVSRSWATDLNDPLSNQSLGLNIPKYHKI